jgi:hypothetical protein
VNVRNAGALGDVGGEGDRQAASHENERKRDLSRPQNFLDQKIGFINRKKPLNITQNINSVLFITPVKSIHFGSSFIKAMKS